MKQAKAVVAGEKTVAEPRIRVLRRPVGCLASQLSRGGDARRHRSNPRMAEAADGRANASLRLLQQVSAQGILGPARPLAAHGRYFFAPVMSRSSTSKTRVAPPGIVGGRPSSR